VFEVFGIILFGGYGGGEKWINQS